MLAVDVDKHQSPYSGETTYDEEHDTLGGSAIPGGEQLRCPKRIERLHRDTCLQSPQQGEGEQTRQTVDADGDDQQPGGDSETHTETVEPTLVDFVYNHGEHKSGGDDDEPLTHAEQVGMFVGEASRRLVDMLLEESHHRTHQVPCEVNACEKEDGAHIGLIGEQSAERVKRSCFLVFSRRGGLHVFPRLRLVQTALQLPGDKSDDEERGEDQTAAENILCTASLGDAKQTGDRFHQAKKDALCAGSACGRGEQGAQYEDDGGTDAPCHLRDTDVAAAVFHLAALGDVSPGSGYPHAHGDACHQKAKEQHREVDRTQNEGNASHIHQHIVGVDGFAPIFVGKKTTDDGADGRTKTVGADGIKPT